MGGSGRPVEWSTTANGGTVSERMARDQQNAAVPHSVSSEILASAALLVYSLAVAAGFARVFSGWDFFDDLALVAVIGHGLALALRLVRVPVWIAFPTTALVLVWLVGAMFYRDTYSLLLPTSDTLTLARLDVDVVGAQFRTAVAPVAFLAGWNLLAALGVGAAVLLADTFAFRAFARAEALVPGGVLFVFVAALGTDRSRIASTMALVAAGVVATVVLRRHHAPQRPHTVGVSRSGTARVVPVAAGSALCVALIAGVVGPRLPGVGAAPIYDTKGGNGGSVTEVISPLVDIRSRLTNRSTTELFVVESDVDSYWRSTALAEFDGVTWKLPERDLRRADGAIGQGAAGALRVKQQITIEALGGRLVPAAAEPVAANAEGDLGDDLRWNPDSAALVKTGGELDEGDTFTVQSASPRFSSATLQTATSLDPDDPIYLDLPDDFPSSVRDMAREVTAGTTSSYGAAIALQNWMRGEFRYSLEIQEGHGNNAIESFLRNRVGYCEQFAGSYAAMMRSIGIPARVAVGFTSGTSDGAGRYSVRGRNAHAWPEVWFDGIGWVPFEPTPGRGAPGAEEYTGVDEQQDDGPADTGADDTATPPVTTAGPATTVVAGGGAVTPTTVPVAPATPSVATPVPPAVVVPDGGVAVPWSWLVVLALVAMALAFPPVVRRVRRSVATSQISRLAHLWDRALDALSCLGLDDSADRTPSETADATALVFPVAARPMHALADVVTVVGYARDGAEQLAAPGAYGTTTLENCASWVRQVERAVTDSLSPAQRLRRYFTHLL